MSVYFPPIDSYMIIEPELFVADKGVRKKKKKDGEPDQDDSRKDVILENTDSELYPSGLSPSDLDNLKNLYDDCQSEQQTKKGVSFLPPIEENDLLVGGANDNNRTNGRYFKHSRSIDFGIISENNQKPDEKSLLKEKRKMLRSQSLFHVQSNKKFAHLYASEPKFVPNPQKARERFYKAIRLMLILKVVARSIAKKSDTGQKSSGTVTDLTVVDDTLEENLRNQGLSFDPSYFKAKKEITISSEVKGILSLPKENRSPEQIQTAMFGLQSLRSFAEYPLHMQEKLCKVAWYEVVPPKRVLIRQGHHAENFYFILSGQAVVTILVRDPKTGESVNRVATIMRKGMSFGELALLHHSRRTATVSSQDTVQLLTVGRQDFFDIFMAGSAPGQIPDHIKFVSQIDFMKNWPIDRLVEHPEFCLLHFFKRNVVIVKDSRVNDWLYVVKSGSCQVMKQLKGVTGRLSLRKKDVKMDDRWELPNLPTAEQEAKIDTGLRRRSAPLLSEEQQRRRWDKILGEATMTSRESSNQDNFSLETYKRQPIVAKPHFLACKSAREERDQKREKRSKYKSPRLRRSANPNPPPAKPSNVFVQVEHLKPRDVFGLPSIQFDDDIAKSTTSVSLVSRGAECIMVSKEFYAKHANEMVKKLIRQQVRPYPAEETFQENLQIKTDWELYKQTMINDLTDDLRPASR
ncbi:hypothetical protein SNE40_015942 [Patella caerulea]|uniref:Cyclic nucleotide-binding domain-containing protein n=1 Tax=Patella caerulea TaxID=87958 RepID=A0AAN8J9Y3_PATCE